MLAMVVLLSLTNTRLLMNKKMDRHLLLVFMYRCQHIRSLHLTGKLLGQKVVWCVRKIKYFLQNWGAFFVNFKQWYRASSVG